MRQESLNIQSYSDNAIILNYLLEDSSILVADSIAYDIPDSLIIERKLESDSIYTEFIIPYIDTTNYYLFRRLKDSGVKISSIARGIAIGDELEYTDEITLATAISSRMPYENSLAK